MPILKAINSICIKSVRTRGQIRACSNCKEEKRACHLGLCYRCYRQQRESQTPGYMENQRRFVRNWNLKNKERVRILQKSYYQRLRDKYIIASTNWRRKNKSKADFQQYSRVLIREFGITREVFDNIVKLQQGMCELCGIQFQKDDRIDFDHCHKTNKPGGLVHKKCNSLIGLAQDDIELLYKAIDYLSRKR